MLPYRGFMLDSVRHMQSIEEIKKLIDTLPLLKINKFHWHLTDDQGWRFESERFPQLNSAAERHYSDFGKTYVNEPHGKLYTKDEMREIVAYCTERGIEVVPEFDIPGHTSALLSAIPSLSCTGEDVEITYCLHALSKPEVSGNTVVIERNGKKLTIIPDENLSLELISDKFDVDLNDGQPERFHVTEPVQYHIYYKSKKQAKHVFNVNYKVEA